MEIDCGIPRQRIIAWLDDELSLDRADERWVFTSGSSTCRVSLGSLPNRVIGKMDLERALLSFEGDQDAVDELYRLFTLRFMSAGG